MDQFTRRGLIVAGLSVGWTSAIAAPPTDGRLAFAVLRNGAKVGEHAMTFSDDAELVRTEVSLLVKLGPVPVYRYTHKAVERWSAGRFASLDTTTNGNGRISKVSARRTPDAVLINAGGEQIRASSAALPLTHWNPAALIGPLFNPQEGKILRLTARRLGAERVKLASGEDVAATRWSLRGESQIDNWYDQGGVWAALRGRLPDGSTMEYRRL